MDFDVETLRKALVSPGHITREQFEKAFKRSVSGGGSVADVLVADQVISEKNIVQAMAQETGIGFLDLENQAIDQRVFSLIPEVVAHSRNVVAVSKSSQGVRVGMLDPMNVETIHMLEKRLNDNVIPQYATRSDIEKALVDYKKDVRLVFNQLANEIEVATLPQASRDKLVVQMVDQLLSYGFYNGASDIHVEPTHKHINIRFRIDGIMHNILEMSKEAGELFLTRIKILSKMRTDEHRAAQDGKFSFIPTASGSIEPDTSERVDVRVSIVPVSGGENIVMRLLSSRNRRYRLEELGFVGEDLEKMGRAVKIPYGMILVTGPTGSGKTTSLYALVQILHRPEVHISTIEDPVEYDIEGISQIQVNDVAGLTFANGLRAIVRQDPDIILVGEIRDKETAGIAVNSAMTGHLVLSTLHANDIATTVPRLMDMGIEPFLLATTLRTIIAQRLVRKICTYCRESYELSREEWKRVLEDPGVNEIMRKRGFLKKGSKPPLVFRGAAKNCNVCNHSGYLGRVGIFEVLETTEELRALITKNANSDDFLALARKQGMTVMLEDGVEKVLQGVTTIEEVLRVTKL